MSKSKDSITLAKDMFNEFLSKSDPQSELLPDEKRIRARMAGKLGGLKGGETRARALSARKRKQIAKKAANTRWNSS